MAPIRAANPATGKSIEYFIDPKGRPLADRPGSENVAPPSDIRWLADIRDILPKAAPLKKTANPAAPYVGKEVAAVVNLEGGMLRANFPSDTVHPKVFMNEAGKVVFQRVLADEFIIDIPYPEETERVTLLFQKLRKGTASKKKKPVLKELKELVLKWPDEESKLVVRMGNDTKDEVRRLDTPEGLDPVRLIGPVLKPRDNDFGLHYNVLAIPDGERLIPQTDIHQCRAEGCKPLMVPIVGGG